MGKAHSKPLAARRGRGTAWVRHGNGMLCVNRPLQGSENWTIKGRDTRRITAAEMKYMRETAGYT